MPTHLPCKSATYSEIELVALLKGHYQEGFSYLYNNYSGALFGVISNLVKDQQLSEDVLQEVFMKVYNNIEVYDATRSKLYTWLLTIARNSAMDMVRSKNYNQMQKHSDFEKSTYHLSVNASLQIDHIGMRKVIGTLRKELRQVIELTYFDGLTGPEISELLNTPLGTIKTRIRTGLQHLRETMHYEAKVA